MKIGEAIHVGVTTAAKGWTQYRKKEFRDRQRGARARAELWRGRARERSIKELAYRAMAEAYAKASGGGKLPASARQIMYQARPMILAETDKPLDDQYFTQQLLPGYMMEHPAETAAWDVVFDARGHLWEPHTGTEIQIGTLNVRSYLADMRDDRDDAAGPSLPPFKSAYPTSGPAHRYRDVLFIEKEGFMPLLQRARIAERFDLAIMSTKGLASTAARTLLEGLAGVRVLVLHDFDKAGFLILGTLQRDTWRYQFAHPPDVVDLGLRLADVTAEGLPAEPVQYHEHDPKTNLHENGATAQEIAFLVSGHRRGQRVELNALTSDRFIAWLEKKLKKVGCRKVIPETETLAKAYRRALSVVTMNATLEDAREAAEQTAEQAAVPAGLSRQVQRLLRTDPMLPWDTAVARIAAAKVDKGG